MLAWQEREAAPRGEGCLGKAADDEPVFILRAQDKIAPILVWIWVAFAWLHGCRLAKVTEARKCAILMRKWPTRKWPD
jgi:hypothetical protein